MNNRVYEENVERIKEFYQSDYYKILKDNSQISYIRNITGVLYKDPDETDKDLLEKAKKYKDEYGIDFSPDGLCGWKLLFDVYGPDKWLDYYKIIKKSEQGTLYWPIPHEKGKGINTLRSALYGDRIDYTLYDIKKIIEGKNTSRINPDDVTKAFLAEFNGDFDEFINKFSLKRFCPNGIVINLESGIELISNKFVWSNSYGPQKRKEKMEKYLNNVIEIIQGNRVF